MCKGTWDRLKWARLQKFGTAEDAAPALGEKAGTYRQYERKPDSSRAVELDHQKAAHFAKKLGVRWQWLLQGEGTPYFDPDENINRIVARLHELDPGPRAEWVETIDRLLKTGTSG